MARIEAEWATVEPASYSIVEAMGHCQHLTGRGGRLEGKQLQSGNMPCDNEIGHSDGTQCRRMVNPLQGTIRRTSQAGIVRKTDFSYQQLLQSPAADLSQLAIRVRVEKKYCS